MLRGTKAAFLAFILTIASFGAGCEGVEGGNEEGEIEEIGQQSEALTAIVGPDALNKKCQEQGKTYDAASKSCQKPIETDAYWCASDQEKDGLLCYAKCPEGYWGQVTRCIQECSSAKPGYYEAKGFPGLCMNRAGQSFVPTGTDRGVGVPPNSCPPGWVKKSNGKCGLQPKSEAPSGNSDAAKCTSEGKYWSQEQAKCIIKGTTEHYVALCKHNAMVYDPSKGSTFPCKYDPNSPSQYSPKNPEDTCNYDPDCMATLCASPGHAGFAVCQNLSGFN